MKIESQSTAAFVYPFVFASESFQRRAERLSAAEWPGFGQVWRGEPFHDEDLLPNVARYLNGPPGRPGQARCWGLDGNAVQSPKGLGGGAIKPACRWTITQRKMEVDFRLASVRLVMFHSGIGFLIIEAVPESTEPAAWFDLIHAFRFIAGGRGTRIHGRRSTREGEAPYFPDIARGAEEWDEGVGTVMDLVAGMLRGGELPEDSEDWWRDVFVPGQAIPYCSLFFAGASAEQDAETVYRLRNLFHSRQELRLGPSDRDLTHDKLLPYVDREWFVVSLDGVLFVAFDAPDTPFFQSTLPGHLAKQYLLVCLVALSQRFKLNTFLEEVGRHWSGESSPARVRAFEKLNKEILSFRANGLFAQVGQRDHLHRFYQKLQHVFEIDRQYFEVSEEVRDMHDYLQVAQAKSLEHRLNLLAVVLGIPGLVLGFLGINILGFTSAEGLNWWTAALTTLGASGVLAYLGVRLLRRQ